MVVGSGRDRATQTAPSEEDALELAAHIREKLGAGVLEEPEGPPTKVADMMDRWLNMKRHEARARASTLETYGFWVKALKQGLGFASLRLLDRRSIQRYVEGRLDAGRSPETVRDEVRILRMALGFAVKRGWWRGHVASLCADLDLPEVLEKSVLSAEEITPFLAAIKDDRTRIACKLALFAGLRAGEVITRQWKDADLRRGVLHIGPKTLPRFSWRTKNGKTRFVPLSADLRADLKAWRLKCGQPGPEAWIVPCRDGSRRHDVRTLNKQVQRACEKAGVTMVTFHGLRHTYVTLSLDAGVDAVTVSRIAGHHSVGFTLDRYAHVVEARSVGAADRLQRHVSDASERCTKTCTETCTEAV